MVGTLMLFAAGQTAAAQRVHAWFEAGGGEARWVTGSDTAGRHRYGMFGARAEVAPNRSEMAVFRGRMNIGRGADHIGRVAWWSGDGGAELKRSVGALQLRVLADAWGVGYEQDVSYRAAGVRVVPSAIVQRGRFLLRTRFEGILGRSQQQAVVRIGPPVPVPAPVDVGDSLRVRLTSDLRLFGSAADVILIPGNAWLRFTPTAYTGSRGGGAGIDASVEGELGLTAGPTTIAAGVRWFSLARTGTAPRESETGMTVRGRFLITSAWALVGYVDSHSWDPLHRVMRGAAAQLGMEWHWPVWPNARDAIAVSGAWDGSGRPVRFRLRAPKSARVELLGSFNGWQATPMHWSAGAWEARVMLAPGSYQYGFRVDGTWTVPAAVASTVEDGWGRRNATLVVEGPSR